MAGSQGCLRIVTGTRLQWLNADGGYKTYYLSYDQYSRNLRSGFGIEYYRNDESNGMMTSDFVHFSFSPTISIGKRLNDSLRAFVIKPAISVGVVDYSINWSKVTFADMIDSRYGFIYNTNEILNIQSVSAPDFGAGMLMYGKNFFGGFYYHHFTQPDLGFLYANSPLPSRLVIHGGYLLKGYKWLGDFVLTPSFIYEQQENMKMMDITLTAKYKYYILGISERFGSAVVFMTGFDCKFIKVGYAYDLNTTAAGRALGSTNEIMLGFHFACRKKYKKIRTLDFPAM